MSALPSIAPSRSRLVCADCSVRLVHRLFTLHAEEETVIVCGGVWESLPKWLQDGWTLLDKKGKSLSKRRELVREMMEYFETHNV